MKKEKRARKQITCSLHGSKICPKPKECNGTNRKCDFWKIHSGR